MARVFILDPVCAMEYGHSLNALKYFADMARQHWDEVHMIASRHLPLPADGHDDGIVRLFDFHYDFALKIDRQPDPVTPLETTGAPHSPESAASVDLSRFFALYDIGPADTLLWPSIDHYSVLALSNVAGGLHPGQCPTLLVRMIGVLENAAEGIAHPDVYAEVITRLRGLLDQQLPISICAETPTYGAELGAALGRPVHVVPYFAPSSEVMALPEDGPITFLSGGSARLDKGFLRLQNIIETVNDRFDPARVHFVIQGPPDALFAEHIAYMRWLYALPNAEILPGQISYDEIKRSFAQSHVALMPYDEATYANRGSAMLMEAMMFGRGAICQAGTGFAGQAELYGAGPTCATDEDFADAIADYAQKAPADIRAQATTARAHYLEDVDRSCRAWIARQEAMV